MKKANYFKLIGRKNSLLFKIALSYIITGSVLLCVFSIFVTRSVLNSHKNDIIDISDKYLLQMEQTTTLLLSGVDNYYYHQLYLNDPTIYSALYGDEYTWQETREITNTLADITKSSPIVSSIYIYNAAADTVFTNNAGVSNIHDFFDRDIIDMIGSVRNLKEQPYLAPRKVPSPSMADSKNEYMLTSVYCEANSIKAPDCAMVINIDQKKLQQLINDNTTISNDIKSFVINSKGTLLTDDSEKNFMTDISNESYFEKIISGGKSHQKVNVDKKTMFLSFVKSDNYDLYFICLTPYAMLRGYGTSLFKNIVVFAFLFIIAGIFIALIFAFLFYKPIRSIATSIKEYNNDKNIPENELSYLSDSFTKLTNNINQLQNDMDKYVDANKAAILTKIILGEYKDSSDIKEYIKHYGLNLDCLSFCVVVFSLDYSSLTDIWNNDIKLLKYGIQNIIDEIIGEHFNAESLDCRADKISVIIGYKNIPENTADVSLCIQDIQESVKTHLSITLTAAIGSIVNTPNNIKYSYKNALNALEYRIIYGKNSIIDFERIDNIETEPYEYPYNIEESMIQALRLDDRDKAVSELNKFISRIANFSCDEINLSVNQLLISFINAINKMAITQISNDYSLNNKELQIRLNCCDTLHDISGFFSSLIENIIIIKAKKNENKNSTIVNKIIEIINTKYTDPGLCVETIADAVSLSPNYVRNIFKTATNQTLSKYIMSVRIERVKYLLINSNAPIAEIAEATGFSTRGYFFTVFKKYMGETPNEFRSNNQK